MTLDSYENLGNMLIGWVKDKEVWCINPAAMWNVPPFVFVVLLGSPLVDMDMDLRRATWVGRKGGPNMVCGASARRARVARLEVRNSC